MAFAPNPPAPGSPPARRLKAVLGTLAVAAAAAGAIAGGAGLIAARSDAALPAAAAPPAIVDLRPVRIESGYTVLRSFVGRLEPSAEADLAFEAGGRVTGILVEEGDRVDAGEVVARLDARALEADRRALAAERATLEAEAELARLTTGRRQALADRGFSPEQALDEARLSLSRLEAAIAAIDARLGGIDVALDKTLLRAPFAAVVGSRRMDPGAIAGSGEPVLTLYSDAAPELRVALPPDLAAALDPDTRYAVRAGGVQAVARLVRRRPDLDPATRTVAAIFEVGLPQGPDRPAFGSTATVVVEQRVEADGVMVPLDALAPGARGSWTVMVHDRASGTVRPEAVEVLHSDGDRAFVRGALRAGMTVVARGVHRLTAGQAVAPAGEG